MAETLYIGVEIGCIECDSPSQIVAVGPDRDAVVRATQHAPHLPGIGEARRHVFTWDGSQSDVYDPERWYTADYQPTKAVGEVPHART